MLRHLLTARDRSVFDRNMAMMCALEAGEPVTGVAKRYGVTRQWLHRLRRRHAEEGEPGLLVRSRRPRSVHNRTSGEVRALMYFVKSVFWFGGGAEMLDCVVAVLDYAMRPSLRRRSVMLVPYWVLMRSSLYQTM